MVFDLTILPGVANTVMGSMGTLDEQQAESPVAEPAYAEAAAG